MRIGSLRHRITIQKFDKIDDGGGGYVNDWVDVTTISASVSPLQGKERYEAQQIQSTLSHKIKMRYLAGILPTMRVLYGSRIFNIISVIDPSERHRELEFLCEEVIVSG
ncbi:phage head closure protein [Brevibacillus choshinensis]|uniref:phage head closure protein n=1 Tax=Brevibacillus choshinensis TaxID=54911 RepID=UPI002E20B322|nr:phage head closure protein [Brevibacillus choshinensis]MED4586668.1 phage head closure protein [Brevibacillus choshinensis]